MLKRLRPWVQTPLATVLLILALGGLVFAVPMAESPCKTSVIGDLIGRVVLRGMVRRTCCLRSPGCFAVRGPEGIRFVDEHFASVGELEAAFTERPSDVLHVGLLFHFRESGLWALTAKRVGASLLMAPLDGDWSTEELADVRRRAAAWFAEIGEIDTASALRIAVSDYSDRRVLAAGYAVNAATVVSLAALVWSLGWVPRVPRRWRERVRAERLARGECPACRYSLAGTPTRCPECGLVIAEPAPPDTD